MLVFIAVISLLSVAALLVHTSYCRGIARGGAGPARAEAAPRDSVTGLGNHRAFREGLHRDVVRALWLGEPVALALVDVDDFAAINAQYGYRQGDRALAAVATLLRAHVPPRRTYRLGDDLFAVVLPHTGAHAAAAAIERLRRDIARACPYGLTVSAGIAALSVDASDADALYERARAALREAKRRGRDAVALFEDIEEPEHAAIPSTAKGYAVRRLLAERRMSVLFQPIWDLHNGGILAYEALTRPAPGYGLSGPLEAFDLAERLGRAHELDAACRRAALDRARELPPDALLFLNLSPQTLSRDDFSGASLAEVVAAAGLEPGRVVLEITEQAPPRPGAMIRAARELRALGFRLALDDVGAGNAGLGMLRQLPVDFVKVDRGVLEAAVGDATARAVFMAIVAFAREARGHIIAEGIETPPMFALAQAAGVRGAQGYLLGRPSEAAPTILAVPQALTA